MSGSIHTKLAGNRSLGSKYHPKTQTPRRIALTCFLSLMVAGIECRWAITIVRSVFVGVSIANSILCVSGDNKVLPH